MVNNSLQFLSLFTLLSLTVSYETSTSPFNIFTESHSFTTLSQSVLNYIAHRLKLCPWFWTGAFSVYLVILALLSFYRFLWDTLPYNSVNIGLTVHSPYVSSTIQRIIYRIVIAFSSYQEHPSSDKTSKTAHTLHIWFNQGSVQLQQDICVPLFNSFAMKVNIFSFQNSPCTQLLAFSNNTQDWIALSVFWYAIGLYCRCLVHNVWYIKIIS